MEQQPQPEATTAWYLNQEQTHKLDITSLWNEQETHGTDYQLT